MIRMPSRKARRPGLRLAEHDPFRFIPVILRRYLVILHDMLAAGFSLVIACFLRLGTLNFPDDTLAALELAIPLFIPLFAVVGLLFRMHQGMWRYASISDLVVIVKTASVAVPLLFALLFLIQRLDGIPRSVPLIQWLVLVAILGGSRLVYRLVRDGAEGLQRGLLSTEPVVPILLVGTDANTPLFLRSLRAAPEQPFQVLGLVALSRVSLGRRILGVPVLGTLDGLSGLVQRLDRQGQKPGRIVVTDPLPAEAMADLVETAQALGVLLCRMPEPLAFREASKRGRIELRPIALEDLLGRPEVRLDHAAIDRLIAGQRVVVTGAGGSIGTELVRQIAARGPAELVLIDHAEYNLYAIDQELGERCPDLPRRAVLCDVRRRGGVMRLFAEIRPQLVFHAAAFKHVPMVELNPCEGMLTNAIGTRNVADAAQACRVRAFVQISTDKAVNPTNVMGASKRFGEFYCQALDLAEGGAEGHGPGPGSRFMTVRFGNVLGSSGSVVPRFQQQLEQGGPLTVTHPEIKRYFMTVPEAVALILHASAHGVADDDARGQIFVLDMGRPIRIVDVARQLIRLAGFEPERDVEIVFTGLRPGEKLYEELFDTAETRLEAPISGVFAAVSRPMSLALLEATYVEIERCCDTRDETGLRQAIARVIPGYTALPIDRAA